MDLRIYLYDKLVSDARAIRQEVFAYGDEGFDKRENKSVHVHIYDGGTLVSYGRMFRDESGDAIIDNVCVRESHRNKKLGRRAVLALEEDANKSGAMKAKVKATPGTAGFFEKLGYIADDSDTDGDIPMSKEFAVKIKFH